MQTMDAAMMLILMLSMAGVPPFAGFWAKWAVLQEVIAAGYVWLAAVAVFFAVIGLFYYLRVVRLMYFEVSNEKAPIIPDSDMRVAISVNALAILFVGIYPAALMGLCFNALGFSILAIIDIFLLQIFLSSSISFGD